jgi:predicted transcriptional regulator of viral defense system
MSDILDLYKSKKSVFNVDDLNKIWNDISRPVLHEKLDYLLNTGKLKRLRRGIYALPDVEVDLNELAGKLKSPSYISFYTVLWQHGIIFQYHNKIYSAAGNSEVITVNGNIFEYKKLKSEIFFNLSGVEINDQYSIASPERAYLDTLYLNPGIGFDNEENLNKLKCLELVEIYKNKRLEQEVNVRFKK